MNSEAAGQLAGEGKPLSKRIIGYDFIKCIAMFLVVLIHYAYYSGGLYENTPASNFVTVVSAVGVPLFFAVNGALLFSKRLDLGKHYGKTLRIILVVVVWKVITVFLLGLIEGISPFVDGKRALVQYLLPGNVQIGGVLNPGHFWFMDTLVALYIVFPIFKLAYDSPGGVRATGVFLVCLFSIASVVPYAMQLQSVLADLTGWKAFDIGGFSQWNAFGAYGYAVLFFVGGGFAPHLLAGIEVRRRSFRIACILVFLLGWLATFALEQYQMDAIGVVFGVDGGYASPVTVIMALSLFAFFSGVEVEPGRVRSLVESIGGNTLGIYFLHMPMLVAAKSLLAGFGVHQLGLAPNAAMVILIFLDSYIISLLLSKVPLVKALLLK